MKHPEQTVQKLRGGSGPPVAPRLLEAAASFSHWLILSAERDGEGLLNMRIEDPEEGPIRGGVILEEPPPAPDEAVFAELKRRLDYVYPYKYAEALPSKLTATELKGLPAEKYDETGSPVFREEYDFCPPEFAAEASGGVTTAQRGTAAHIVMQHIDFSKAGSVEGIRAEIERIRALGHLSDPEARAVDENAILGFFRSDIGKRVLAAPFALREFRFSLLCPAGRFFDASAEDEVLLQGVVDCCIEEEGELTIIDYKTDYVNISAAAEHTKRYIPQLRAYSMAMSRVTGKSVRQAFVYYLGAGTAVEVEIAN